VEPVFILVFVGVLVVGVVAWLGHQASVARREALARVAAGLGFRFSPEARDWGGGLFSRRQPLAPFPVFDKGHSRRSVNHLEGELLVWDRALGVTLGDYRYKITSGSGKNQSTRTYELSFLLLRLPFGNRVPDLRVRREGFGDRVAAAVGFADINFESAEFSRRFHVRSSDRRFTYNLIDPRMMAFLLDVEPPEFAISQGMLLVMPAAGLLRWEPETFGEALRWTQDFLVRWPEFVVKDLSSR
jgi:hypothetical protein